MEEVSEPVKEDCESKQHLNDIESKDLQSDNKETKLVQDDAPAETFVAENDVWVEIIVARNIAPTKTISDENEDIEMQRLLRIMLYFSYFLLLKLNADHKLTKDRPWS